MNNKPVAWAYIKDGEFWDAIHPDEHAQEEGSYDIPLYTQDQLEEARKLGMQQERAMWNLSASTQEIMDTHPVKELNDGGEPVKNATYWKRQYNLMATQNDNLKSGLYHANEQIKYLESHPVEEQDTECKYCKQGCIRCDARKQLTDEEIDECSCFVNVELSQRYGSIESIDNIDWTITGLRAFARALLRKAQEK